MLTPITVAGILAMLVAMVIARFRGDTKVQLEDFLAGFGGGLLVAAGVLLAS